MVVSYIYILLPVLFVFITGNLVENVTGLVFYFEHHVM